MFRGSSVTINQFSINRDYDRSVRFTILCFQVSVLVQFLQTFSRVPLVSYNFVKSESRHFKLYVYD